MLSEIMSDEYVSNGNKRGRIKLQKADARFADAAAWSALLLPQVKNVIDTNASVSATLTERINAQLQKQQNTETSNAQTAPGSDGNAKQSGGLTQEQRKSGSLRPERLRTHVGKLENDMPGHMPADPPGRSRRGAPAFSWWRLMTDSW